MCGRKEFKLKLDRLLGIHISFCTVYIRFVPNRVSSGLYFPSFLCYSSTNLLFGHSNWGSSVVGMISHVWKNETALCRYLFSNCNAQTTFS